jgi:hypothetical protein
VPTIEKRKRILGHEHPSTLNSPGNIASIFWNTGRLKELEELEEMIMETKTRVFGQEHPNTLISMLKLACTYKSRHRMEEAIAMMQQVPSIRSATLG